jgi:hypothetical protein
MIVDRPSSARRLREVFTARAEFRMILGYAAAVRMQKKMRKLNAETTTCSALPRCEKRLNYCHKKGVRKNAS